MLASDDTIAAIATPPGPGGVGIVRLSGPRALPITLQLFHPSRPQAVLRSHRLVHGAVRDPADGTVIDECLVCYMQAPRSYTGEHVAEFQCHGSPMGLQRLLSCCLRLGARPAERGEFTLRAFLNGRIDLAQAEAVISLVSARTPTAAQAAAQALTGALGRSLQEPTHTLNGALAYLEAAIDFSDEDLPEHAAPRLAERVSEARQCIEEVLRRARHGALLRDGLHVVLAGKPNVGKSSLLNAVLRRDRAIVTPIAGTTRDTLEEAADIHGLLMYLIDTAGLAATADPVERLGIARSTDALRTAGIVVMVVDATTAPDDGDRLAAAAIHREAPGTPLLLVCNKCDVPEVLSPSAFLPLFGDMVPSELVVCSATTGEGIAALEDALSRLALAGENLDAETAVVETVRQREALETALDALRCAEQGLLSGRPAELVCVDLRTALDSLGAITGTDVGEALLDRIFSDFCIGK